MGGHISADHGRTTTSRHGGSCRRARLSSRQCRPRRASLPALLFVAMAGAVQAVSCSHRRGILDAVELGTQKKKKKRCRRAQAGSGGGRSRWMAMETSTRGGWYFKYRPPLGSLPSFRSYTSVPD